MQEHDFQIIFIIGHHTLWNITLRDKRGDAHRNRLTTKTISFILRDTARGNFNPHKLLLIIERVLTKPLVIALNGNLTSNGHL